MRTISTAFISAALFVCACSTDHHESVSTAISSQSDLTTFGAAIQFASVNNDIVDELDVKPATLTVFAPTNAAWDALAVEVTGNPNAIGTDLFTPANQPLVRSIVQYHIVDTATLPVATIPFGFPIQTTEGSVLKIESGNPPVITDGQSRMAAFVAADFVTENGVVHKIDTVLLPPTMTIAATVQSFVNTGSFTIFAQAVAAAQLVGVLNSTTPVTLFIPTDAAFRDLLAELGMSLPELLTNPQLIADVLKYHVVPGTFFVASLPVATPIQTLETGTFTVDQNLIITDARGRTAHIIETDVITTNGAIQVIDRVLLP